MFMRMYENFTGCRVVSYCLMCNHFHLLLEVPPLPPGGFSDAELLGRLAGDLQRGGGGGSGEGTWRSPRSRGRTKDGGWKSTGASPTGCTI